MISRLLSQIRGGGKTTDGGTDDGLSRPRKVVIVEAGDALYALAREINEIGLAAYLKKCGFKEVEK